MQTLVHTHNIALACHGHKYSLTLSHMTLTGLGSDITRTI